MKFFDVGKTIISIYNVLSTIFLFGLLMFIGVIGEWIVNYVIGTHFFLSIAVFIFYFIWYFHYLWIVSDEDATMQEQYRRTRNYFLVMIIIYGLFYIPFALLVLASASSPNEDVF